MVVIKDFTLSNKFKALKKKVSNDRYLTDIVSYMELLERQMVVMNMMLNELESKKEDDGK